MERGKIVKREKPAKKNSANMVCRILVDRNLCDVAYYSQHLKLTSYEIKRLAACKVVIKSTTRVSEGRRVENKQVFPSTIPVHRLTPLANVCAFCEAVFFKEEINNRSKMCSLCCQNGKVKLEKYGTCPPDLKLLLTSTTTEARNFRNQIRYYNSSFAFASTVGKYQNMGVGPHVVKVIGPVRHIMPQIIPATGRIPVFGQIYFLERTERLNIRFNNSQPCEPDIISKLDDMIGRVNPFAEIFKMLQETFLRINSDQLQIALAPNIDTLISNHCNSNTNRHFYINKVGTIYIGSELEFPVDITRKLTIESPQTIRDMSSLLEPLSYPLLFPNGELGWSNNIKHNDRNTTQAHKTVTCREYIAFRLAIRREFSILHNAGKLFLQWLVDSWCRIDGLNLQYLRRNQNTIKGQKFLYLEEYLKKRATDCGLIAGVVTILPATFVGGPRYMGHRYKDAVQLEAIFGKPDLFITFRANSQWPDVTENLPDGQEAMHRPDLVCRVFKIKLDYLIYLIEKKNIFGEASCIVYVIEFQNRGLPHAHILVTFKDNDRILSTNQIDCIIRADIPNPLYEFKLHKLVTSLMIHRKCDAGKMGVTCFENGRCRYGYPKDFQEETSINFNEKYPKYKRPNLGAKFHDVNNDIVYDNRDVIPYSPLLLSIFEAHINVEVCNTSPIKYLFKCYESSIFNSKEGEYENNGTIHWDEIRKYENNRSVTAHEAFWRIMSFPITYSSVSVFLLNIHLPNQANFTSSHQTHLTAWFGLNSFDLNARQLYFVDVVKHYTWHRQQKKWVKRHSRFSVVGRIPNISRRDGELYYLKLLLGYMRGVTSFIELCTYNGYTHSSFQNACIAHQLIGVNDD